VDTGYLIQFRGEGLISDWIRLVSGGIHTHTAMVVRRDDGSLAVAEMREFKGGRITSLYEQYRDHQWQMDFYKPNTEKYPELNLNDAAEAMKFICRNGQYSYLNLLKILIRRIPILWRFFDRGVDDDEMVNPDEKKWHCSDSVAAAYQYGGVDPVPAMPHELVSPSDLTNSLLFTYQFSL
jgi:hypothetical protein